MRRIPAGLTVAAALALSSAVTACGGSAGTIVDGSPVPRAGCTPVGAEVNIDYATSEGGAATPVLAAERFARNGGAQDLQPPSSGWSPASGGTRIGSVERVILRNDNWRLETTQGSDGGWLVTTVRCVRP